MRYGAWRWVRERNVVGAGSSGTAVDSVRDGRTVKLCPECGRVNGCHPHCENAADISAFEDFCGRFDAELVTVHTNAYTAEVNAKREAQGLPPVPHATLLETSDYRRAIREFFKAIKEEEK